MFGNMVQMQDDMRNLSDEQLRQIVQAPSHPMAPVVALGIMQERQKLRADHQARQSQPAQATVMDQIMARSMTPAGQPVADPMAAQEPVRMQEGGPVGGGFFGQAQNDYLSALQGLMGQSLPGMIPGADNLDSSIALMRQYMPDRYGAYNRMAKEYDAGAEGRQQDALMGALLQLGSGLMASDSPHALRAMGEAGMGALPAFMEARQLPQQEQQAQMERALAMAGVQSGQDATVLQGGLSAFNQNQDVIRDTAGNIMDLGLSREERAADEAENERQRQSALEIVRMQMRGSGSGTGGLSNAAMVEGRRRAALLQTQINQARDDAQAIRSGLQNLSGAEREAAIQRANALEQRAGAIQQELDLLNQQYLYATLPTVDISMDLPVGRGTPSASGGAAYDAALGSLQRYGSEPSTEILDAPPEGGADRSFMDRFSGGGSPSASASQPGWGVRRAGDQVLVDTPWYTFDFGGQRERQ